VLLETATEKSFIGEPHKVYHQSRVASQQLMAAMESSKLVTSIGQFLGFYFNCSNTSVGGLFDDDTRVLLNGVTCTISFLA